MIYSALIQNAVRFATDVHAKQTRKGKDTPYITHLLGVALILARAGADEDVVVAGVLHDAIEDSPKENKITKEILAEKFGNSVAELVDAVTEQNKELPWAERKQIALEHIKDMDHNALLLKSADVLHNLSELIHDVEQESEEVFEKFNAPKEDKLVQQEKLVVALTDAWPANPLLPEIKEKIAALPR